MRQLDRARLYASAASDVASRLHCACIDLFARIHSMPNWQECLSDGLHLSQQGNRILFESVRDVISDNTANTPHLHPELAPPHFPMWSDLADAADSPETLIPPMQAPLQGLAA